MSDSRLTVENVECSFGGVRALRGVSLECRVGEIHAVIGSNGAGKTTLFNVMTGLVQPSTGRVCLDGRDLTRAAPHRRVHAGLVRTFQVTSIFMELTVRENVNLATRSAAGENGQFWRASSRSAKSEVDELLQRIGLTDKAERVASSLAHGDQRLLDIAIGLALKPRFLLLDEPTAGMSRKETIAMSDVVASLRDKADGPLGLMIVEHDMEVVFSLADRVTVFHQGQVLATGTPESVQKDERVREAYLGG